MEFEDRYLGFGTYFTDEMKQDVFSTGVRGEMETFDAYKHHRRFFENCRGASPINRLLYVDFKTFMPALNLIRRTGPRWPRISRSERRF